VLYILAGRGVLSSQPLSKRENEECLEEEKRQGLNDEEGKDVNKRPAYCYYGALLTM
jgi:hypothetical protein